MPLDHLTPDLLAFMRRVDEDARLQGITGFAAEIAALTRQYAVRVIQEAVKSKYVELDKHVPSSPYAPPPNPMRPKLQLIRGGKK
jgi:hypothetical protein